MSSNHQFDPQTNVLSVPSTLPQESSLIAVYTNLTTVNHQLEQDQARLKELERKVGNMQYLHTLPDSNLFSDNFLKRAFAIFGYWLVAYLFVAIPFFVLASLLGG